MARLTVGIGGGCWPVSHVKPRQGVQLSTNTLGTTDDMHRVIALARGHGILATATGTRSRTSTWPSATSEHKIAERGVLTF